jgi:hypothetical protein
LTDSAVAAKWPNFLLPAGLSGTVLAAIGALGWLAGIPWLLPSLGPTLAIQTSTPLHASARMRNVAFGHGIGLAAGLLAVFLTGAAHAPAVMDMVKDTLSLERVAASVIAVALSLAVQHRFKLTHPPAEATTLIVALGGVEPTPAGALTVVAAIALSPFSARPHGGSRRAHQPWQRATDIHGELSRPVLKSPPAYSAARRG